MAKKINTNIYTTKIMRTKATSFDTDNYDETAENRFALAELSVDPSFDMKNTFHLLQTPVLGIFMGKNLPPAWEILEHLHSLANDIRLKEDALDEFYRTEIGNFPALLQLFFALSTNWSDGDVNSSYGFLNSHFAGMVKKIYGFDLHHLKSELDTLERLEEVCSIIRRMAMKRWDSGYANKVAANVLCTFLPAMDRSTARKTFSPATINDKNELRTIFLFQHSAVRFWMSDLFADRRSAQGFTEFFSIVYRFYSKCDFLSSVPEPAFFNMPLDIFDFGRACSLGIIPAEEVKLEMTARAGAIEAMKLVSPLVFSHSNEAEEKMKRYDNEDFSALKQIAKETIDAITREEISRGEDPTAVTRIAASLERIEGAATWISLIKGLENDSLERLDYYYGTNYSKREVFCKLLRASYPSTDDNAETITDIVKELQVPDERITEAAIYSPQWVEMVEEYLDIKGERDNAQGLADFTFFLHAHIGKRTDEWLLAKISRFTPIDTDCLRNGAFDLKWFLSIKRKMSAKAFKQACDTAFRIFSPSDFSALKKNMEIASGNENTDAIMDIIRETRSKDLLTGICLAPLDIKNKLEVIDRYKYVLQFAQESRVFSTQKRDSERRAAQNALTNLSQSAKYFHLHEFIWDMEATLFKNLEPLFKSMDIEGTKVHIKINESHEPELVFFKTGWGILRNIPNKLRKHPYIATLREAVRQLKNPVFGSSSMLETAMMERLPLEFSKLQKWRMHPTIMPMIENLVFMNTKKSAGFLTDQGLKCPDGDLVLCKPSARLFIAHPLELHKIGALEGCRKHLVGNNLSQSLEQVGREFFPFRDTPLHISMEIPDSFTWQTDGMGGRQRVFYRKNIVVKADSSGKITFLDRLTTKILDPKTEVPELIFSEIIRELSKFKLLLS